MEDDLSFAPPAYIHPKIRISRELPHIFKVFASKIIHGASHLPKEYLDKLSAQTQRNVTCLQIWIDRGQLAPVDPHHLLFAIWATTQTYADSDWQISIVTGKKQLGDADYDTAAETITHLVLKGYVPNG